MGVLVARTAYRGACSCQLVSCPIRQLGGTWGNASLLQSSVFSLVVDDEVDAALESPKRSRPDASEWWHEP